MADLLLALDCQDKIVARTVADAANPALAQLPAIGTHMRPHDELVLAQKPDLVLQLAGRHESGIFTEKLRRHKLNALTFEIANFEQLLDVTLRLGKLVGKEQKARELVADWQKRLQALRTGQPEKRPGIYYEVRQPNLLAAGQTNMVNAIIVAAGGENVVKTPRKLARYNEEALLMARPDFCIVQQGPMNPAPPPISKRANLKSLPCARAGRNIVVDEMGFARPGPASVSAAEKLAFWLRESGEQN